MIELTTQLFGIAVEILFSALRSFSKELIDHDGQWLTDASNGFAVPPEQVRLRQADVLFGYDLSVQLFGGNGHVSVDAQKASFSAENARGRADGELLRQMVRRFLQRFAKEKFTIALSVNAHAKTESKAIQEEYVQRFRFNLPITKPGAVGYLHLHDWPTDIRFIASHC